MARSTAAARNMGRLWLQASSTKEQAVITMPGYTVQRIPFLSMSLPDMGRMMNMPMAYTVKYSATLSTPREAAKSTM